MESKLRVALPPAGTAATAAIVAAVRLRDGCCGGGEAEAAAGAAREVDDDDDEVLCVCGTLCPRAVTRTDAPQAHGYGAVKKDLGHSFAKWPLTPHFRH